MYLNILVCIYQTIFDLSVAFFTSNYVQNSKKVNSNKTIRNTLYFDFYHKNHKKTELWNKKLWKIIIRSEGPAKIIFTNTTKLIKIYVLKKNEPKKLYVPFSNK